MIIRCKDKAPSKMLQLISVLGDTDVVENNQTEHRNHAGYEVSNNFVPSQETNG